MPDFTKKEKKVLKDFFTNTEKPVFCLINLPEVVKGTLFSRYSRSSKDLRSLFLDEFYTEKSLKSIITKKVKSTKELNIKKAQDFYDRILIGYGDDSVAELGGAHIAVENISNVAAKIIEDSRIGISPLEKSTRYVFFDKKDQAGEYRFYKDPEILKSDYKSLYLDFINELFDFYSNSVRNLYKFFTKTIAKEKGVSQKVFKASCRAKACDIARYILPMSTLTNVGLYGNGRAFEYLLTRMYAHPLAEIQTLAKQMHEELEKVIPSFVKRANDKKGKQHQEYIQKTTEVLKDAAQMILEKKGRKKKKSEDEEKKKQYDVNLTYWERTPLDRMIAHMVFPDTNLSLDRLQFKIRKLPKGKKEGIVQNMAKNRKNRRHKVPRVLENTYYTFQIESDIGAFRDLHRHRMLTQQRQKYTTKLGFVTPQEIKAAGFDGKFNKMMEKADKIYRKIGQDLPIQAQYLVPLAYKIRYYFTLNLREAVYLTELRSSRQGHPSYRKIAQEIAREIIDVHPSFEPLFTFVDYKKYKLERLEAFKKLE